MLTVTSGNSLSKLAYMELKQRIKTARKAARLTQEQLAARVGVSRPAVVQWESGDTKALDGVNLVRTAIVTGVEPLWLATEEGSMHAYMVRDEPNTVPLALAQAWKHMDKGSRDHLLAIAITLAENKKITRTQGQENGL